MNRRGYTLLQTLLAASASLLVILALVMLMRTLLSATVVSWTGDGEDRYAVSPSLSEGVRATRFHLALNRLRREADAVFVFGGDVYRAEVGGAWQHSLDRPLRMDFDMNGLSHRLHTEEAGIWFQRMAFLGGTQFFQNPVPLLSEYELEDGHHKGDFTVLFLSGRDLVGVIQVRCHLRGTDSVQWQQWECKMWDFRIGRETVYRCAWQQGEMTVPQIPLLPFIGIEEGRLPGVRQFRVKAGIADGGELTFAEIVFPDPMLVWSAGSQQEGSYPVSRFFYLFFFQ